MRLLMVLLPLVVAYAPTFDWMYRSWGFGDEYYSHGPILLIVALWLAFARCLQWPIPSTRWDPRGWFLLGPGLLVHLCGAALMIDSLSGFSLALALPGALWLAFGVGWLRRQAPVLGLIPLLVPVPIMVQGELAFELKEFAIHAGLELANLLGAGAERAGAEIRLAGLDGSLLVADPCSGLRSLVALVTLGYCVAFFIGRQGGTRPWILLAAAVPIAILSNVLRIAGILLVARLGGIEVATGAAHDLAGVGLWLLDLALLLALDWLLTRSTRGGR